LGIRVDNQASATVIRGNYIGTNAAGTAAIPNADDGIFMNLAAGVTIGGTSPAARNLLSGNNGDGVEFDQSTRGVLQGNYIGTNVTGTAALANKIYGVRVPNSPGGLIGGTAPGAGNVISGNLQRGIELFGAPTMNTTVQGNY